MDVIGSVAAVVVGAVFVVAGASKLSATAVWHVDALALGAPPVVAAVLPWWELSVGALAIAGVARPWPSVAAAVTLIGFSALLVRVLGRGEHPACACFGGWSARPLGWHHVARNAVLFAFAIVSVVLA